MASYQPLLADTRKHVILLFRGAPQWAGGYPGELTTFEANMESIVEHLVEPLESTGKYKVFILADLQATDAFAAESQRLLSTCFGRSFLACRLQA